MKKRVFRARGGYTLIEVATSVVIVAALTAAVVPAVIKQVEQADRGVLVNDLNSTSKAIETFRLNVGTYPSRLYQLAFAVDASTTIAGETMYGGPFNNSQVNSWRGPYSNRGVAALGESLVSSVFKIDSYFHWFNSVTSVGQQGGVPADAGTDYIAIQVTNISEAEFGRIKPLIDGETFLASQTGRFRQGASSTAYYLAIPVSN
jgi:type II secretory pathway pseudopilin PulG